MRFQLKIWQKALLLVAVPLVFELIFIGSLAKMLSQAEYEAKRITWAHQILVSVNKLMTSFVGCISAISAPQITGLPMDEEEYRRQGQSIRESFSELIVLCHDNPVTTRKLERIKADAEEALSITDQAIDLNKHGQHSQSLIRREALKPLFERMDLQLAQLSSDALEIENSIPKIQTEQRQRTVLFLLAGLVTNIALAVYIAWAFHRQITSRLFNLVENTHRFKQRLPMTPPAQGQDELATLDRTFQTMAQALTIAAENQRNALNEIETIITTMPVGLIVANQDGTIKQVNATMASLAGREAEALGGRPAASIFELPDFDSLKQKATQTSWITEISDTTGSGRTPVEVSISTATIFGEQRWLLVAADVTARRDLEKMREDLLAMVTHDLRTPLASIQMFLEMTAAGRYPDLTSAEADKANSVLEEASRLMTLVNNLLDFERINAGKMQLSMERRNVADLIERAILSVSAHSSIADTNCRIEKRIAAPYCHCDGDRLTQVLENLLVNAIRHSPPGSDVTVAARELAHHIEFSITDCGAGVDANVIDEMFQHLKSAADGRVSLGLPLCKAIVELHGGSVQVQSSSKGTTITFQIPNQEQPTIATTKRERQELYEDRA